MNATAHATMPTEVKNDLADYPELLRKLLFHRGITDPDTAQAFLEPAYEQHVHDAGLLPDIEPAVARILDAIENNEHIAVYADYDADGIPGAVILHDFFTKVGFDNFEVYLPHRHDEGYGFHTDAVDTLAGSNTKLIITVDVGITEADTVAHANNLGIDVIVTDHHEPNENIPDAVAVVNPKLGSYPEPMLCGAAVAWKLVVALIDHGDFDIPAGWEKWLLDMVGIATISDMVPLTGENRVLAYFGLKVLRKSRRPGLRLLLKKINTKQQHLTEDDISFMITPRINAASRMSHPIEAFKVLAATTQGEAQEAVEHLVEMNNERKTLVATTVKKAKATLKKREIREVIVIGDPEWQGGILGLVATKITEQYDRPCFVWSKEAGVIKGSCRASNGVSVVDIMTAAGEHFIQFGGHAGAGGFSVELDQVHHLEDALVDAYNSVKTEETEQTAEFMFDGHLELAEVTMGNYALIEKCAPFGIDNLKPAFIFENITIKSVRTFGKTNNHTELAFNDANGRTVKAIQFFKTPEDFKRELKTGETINLLAHFDHSMFMGRSELRLRILDIS